MQCIPYKEVSLDGRISRHYIISPKGDVVCSTHTAFAAAILAGILNTHGGKVLGKPVMEWDWAAASNREEHAA